jgi:hypothetical protein
VSRCTVGAKLDAALLHFGSINLLFLSPILIVFLARRICFLVGLLAIREALIANVCALVVASALAVKGAYTVHECEAYFRPQPVGEMPPHTA